MENVETSLIIRTFNEEKHVRRLLESVADQRYRDYEIVLVDSGSLDRTRDIASEFTDKLLRISSHDFTFGYSLNVGIKAASGAYAAIVSAHTIPTSEDWLGNLIEPLRSELTAMAFGRQYGCPTSKFSEIRDLDRTFGDRYLTLRPPNYFAHNGNSAIRRDLWLEHPFDEELTGLEDIEWAKYWMDKGYSVIYEPQAAIHHIHEEQWKQIQNRYYREALALRSMDIKGANSIPVEVLKEFGFAIVDIGDAVLGRTKEFDCISENLIGRSRQIINFRYRKLSGTIRGLLDGSSVRNSDIRHSVFFRQRNLSLVVQGVGKVGFEEIDLPEVKPGDVMIRVAYNGICGKDVAIADGTLFSDAGRYAAHHVIPGHEVSGTVVFVGTNISNFEEGDPVVIESMQGCGSCPQCQRSNWIACPDKRELGSKDINGGCSKYVVVPGQYVHKLPSGMPLDKAALSEPLSIVLKGLNRVLLASSGEYPSKRCAVLGAGSMGHLAAKVLDLKGYKVQVFDQDPRRRSYFDGTDIDVNEYIDGLGEFEILVEATGDADVVDKILRESMPGSSILLLGLPQSYREFTFENIVNHDKTIIGSVGTGPTEMDEAIELLPRLELDNFLQCIIPLSRFQDALESFSHRRFLKVILDVES